MGVKIPKKPKMPIRDVCYSYDEALERVWIENNRYNISRKVGSTKSYALLKEIDALINKNATCNS